MLQWLLAFIPTNGFAQERQARLNAEAALAASEAALAASQAALAASQASAAQEREVANKKIFLILMSSISSAGSGDTASRAADEARWVALMPPSAELDEMLRSLSTTPSLNDIFALGARLSSGGSSDVYDCSAELKGVKAGPPPPHQNLRPPWRFPHPPQKKGGYEGALYARRALSSGV